jgi:hypothetical protein
VLEVAVDLDVVAVPDAVDVVNEDVDDVEPPRDTEAIGRNAVVWRLCLDATAHNKQTSKGKEG